MAQHRVQQWATFARMWWIYDAKWQSPFVAAPLMYKYLSGQHKPIFHPLSDVGDHVVVVNTRDIALEGTSWRTFMFYHHTGYPGGFSATRAYKVHDNDPTKIFYKSVYRTIPGNLLRKNMMCRLHLYPDENVPDEILKNVTGQIRQLQPVPKRLDEFSVEERSQFPRLFDWPEDYVEDHGNRTIKPGEDSR